MIDRKLDPVMVDRAANVLERGADRLADAIGDEVAASALLATWLDFVAKRWGACCVYEKLTGLRSEIGDHIEAVGGNVPDREMGR